MPAPVKPLVAAAAAMSCIAFGAPPAGASAAGPSCGAVVVKSTTLRANLTNCPGDGLVIGADGITLDLGGHTIDGAATPDTAGIRLAGHHGVTVQRGSLQEFGNGVLLDNADGNALFRVTVTRSVARGIQLQNGSAGNRLEFDVSTANGSSGFGLLSSDRNVIAHATGSHNTFSGLQGFTASGNRIINGTFPGNRTGIGLADGSNGNLVTGNALSGNTESAIEILFGNDNVVTGNRATHSGNGVSFAGDRNQIVGNRVKHAVMCGDGCGAGLDGSGGTGNLVAGNRVIDTEMEGIRFNEYEADGGPPVIGNVVRGNIVRKAGTDGIAFQNYTDQVSGHGTLKDNLIEGNLVFGSSRDGTTSGGPRTPCPATSRYATAPWGSRRCRA